MQRSFYLELAGPATLDQRNFVIALGRGIIGCREGVVSYSALRKDRSSALSCSLCVAVRPCGAPE
jgi:hypothetical protein